MRVLSTILGLAFALVIVLFAVSNRSAVVLEIWPLPYTIETGLYAAILVAVLAGFVAGAIAMWLAGGAKRRDLRLSRRRVKDLEQSLAQAKAEAASSAQPKA